MADSKINALAENAAPAAADVLPIVTGAADAKRVSLSSLAAFFGNIFYPVGAILISSDSANPATYLGFGTWVAEAVGRFLVGVDAGDPDFDASGDTGGAKTHVLTTAEIPAHTHVQDAHTHVQNQHRHQTLQERSATTGAATTRIARTNDTSSTADTAIFTEYATPTNQNATAVNQNAGGGGAHNNLPPFVARYCWRRSA